MARPPVLMMFLLLLTCPFAVLADVVLCGSSFPTSATKVTIEKGSCAPDSQLPDLSDLASLVLLSAPEAVLTGTLPPSLSSLAALRTLNLPKNQLTGTIPDLRLTQVRAVHLQENLLWGEITAVFPSSLRWLQLFNNGLTGSLPVLTGFPWLRSFGVSGNQLTGTIPLVSPLPTLEALSLSNNQLTGTVPLLPKSILRVVLSGNQFSGDIPDLHANTKLTRIVVPQASLSGTIPEEISTLIHLDYINLATNTLSGTIPDLRALTSLGILSLNENSLSGGIVGILPPSIMWLNVAENQLTGSLPRFTDLPLLVQFVARKNGFSGSIPSLSSLSDLQRMILAENELTGSVPVLPDNGVFWRFTANHNPLTGTVPSLASHASLQQIALQNTLLHGDVPELPVGIETAVFENSNFDGTIPDLSSYTNLRYFDVSNNALTGTVSGVVSTSLTTFDLASNKLSSPFPSFPQASQLERLHLADNDWLCPMTDYHSWAPTTDHALMNEHCDVQFTVSSSDNINVGAQNVLELGLISSSELTNGAQFEYGPFGAAGISGCTSSSPATLQTTALSDGKSGLSVVLQDDVPQDTWFQVTCGYSMPESPIQPAPKLVSPGFTTSAVIVSDPDTFLLSLLPPCNHAPPEAVSAIAVEVTQSQALLVRWNRPTLACDNAQSFKVLAKRALDEWGSKDEAAIAAEWEAPQMVDYLHVRQSPLDYIPPTSTLLQGFAKRYWYSFAVVPANQEESQAAPVWSCPVWLADFEPSTLTTCVQPTIPVDVNPIPNLTPPSTTQRWAFSESEIIFRHFEALHAQDLQKASTDVTLYGDNYEAILAELQEECSSVGYVVSLVFEPIGDTLCAPLFIFTSSDDRGVRKATATMAGRTTIKETGVAARVVTLGWCPSMPFFSIIRAMRAWQSGSPFRVADTSDVRALLEPNAWQTACSSYFGTLLQDQTLCSVDASDPQQPLYRMLHEEVSVPVQFLPVVSSVALSTSASGLATFADSTGPIHPHYGWHDVHTPDPVPQCEYSNTVRLFGDGAVWYPCVEVAGQWFVLPEPTITTHSVPETQVESGFFGSAGELMSLAVLPNTGNQLLYRSLFDTTKQHGAWSFSRLSLGPEDRQQYEWKALYTAEGSWDELSAAVSGQSAVLLSPPADLGLQSRHAFTVYNQAPQHLALQNYWSVLERRARVLRKMEAVAEVYTLTGALGTLEFELDVNVPAFFVKAVCVQHSDGSFSSHAYVLSNAHSAFDWSVVQPVWDREVAECYSLARLGDIFPTFVQLHMPPAGRQAFQAQYPNIPLEHAFLALASEQFAGSGQALHAAGTLPEQCITAPFVQPEGCLDALV